MAIHTSGGKTFHILTTSVGVYHLVSAQLVQNRKPQDLCFGRYNLRVVAIAVALTPSPWQGELGPTLGTGLSPHPPSLLPRPS